MVAELATSLTATNDERLLQAEATVRSYCGWHIAPLRTDTLTFDCHDGVILLPTLQLVEVVSLVTNSNGLTVDPADYVPTRAGVITCVAGWSYGLTRWGSVTVEFTHGYEVPPADVTAVVQGLAQRAVSGRDGLASKAVGPFSESYTSDLYGNHREVLARYKLPPRP